MKKNKIYLIISVLFLILSAVIFLTLRTDKKYDEAKAKQVESNKKPVSKLDIQNYIKSDQELDITEGEIGAPVTIIEYASYSCAHCADFYKNLYPQIKANFIDKGKVRFIFRDFPLDEPSLRASQLIHCMPDGKKNMMKVLFESQTSWAYKKDFPEKLENFAKIQGLTSDFFHACMSNKELEEQILEKRMSAFEAFNINSTPSLIINGQLYIGQKNWYEISEYITNLLEAK
ncbi:MAG: DsbA family protein [Alphaproteobacteria bacterium]|jgi:protein-disulfide isomerase|nr:DsbA family protein [Alphaproteobacteria bacterium]MBT5828505.1 DsbA family protein [Alphaproteobacteria bacterium]